LPSAWIPKVGVSPGIPVGPYTEDVALFSRLDTLAQRGHLVETPGIEPGQALSAHCIPRCVPRASRQDSRTGSSVLTVTTAQAATGRGLPH